MTMIVGKVMTNQSNTLIFYPIWDSLLIAVWTQSGRLPIITTLTFHHEPTQNSIFTSPNSIHLICIFVPPLYFLSIFIHALLSLSHDRTLTPSLFAFLVSLLFFLTLSGCRPAQPTPAFSSVPNSGCPPHSFHLMTLMTL